MNLRQLPKWKADRAKRNPACEMVASCLGV
ncbi:MAG: hypothetical protein H6Q38_3277, partial [Chloroflexi bacterium]|nr:hypothetical protein [Chloroflexota bacterium]